MPAVVGDTGRFRIVVAIAPVAMPSAITRTAITTDLNRPGRSPDAMTPTDHMLTGQGTPEADPRPRRRPYGRPHRSDGTLTSRKMFAMVEPWLVLNHALWSRSCTWGGESRSPTPRRCRPIRSIRMHGRCCRPCGSIPSRAGRRPLRRPDPAGRARRDPCHLARGRPLDPRALPAAAKPHQPRNVLPVVTTIAEPDRGRCRPDRAGGANRDVRHHRRRHPVG